MSVSKLALLVLSVLLLQSVPRAASDSASDSLILKEIADSLGVQAWENPTRKENGRVTFLSIHYRSQHGAVPSSLGGLDSLRHLFIHLTRVTSLPREIGRLKRLDTINIGTSDIGPAIPDEIGDLSNLRCLKVHSSRLETLPTSLMKLQNLEAVDFTHNRICRMDDSLRQWILSKWPKALDNQNTSMCASTDIGFRQSPPSPQVGAPFRRLAVPGVRKVLPEQDGVAKGMRYYTPLGRSLGPQEILVPPGADSRD